jgi:hypothetical protein
LRTSGTGRGVWVKQDTTNHRLIVQWKAAANIAACSEGNGQVGDYSQTNLDFEVMLYDTTYTPTMDGNGEIVMQYNVAAMDFANEFCDQPRGCTIGIQAPRGLVGLQYAYDTTYSPGAARIMTGRAIKFTTSARLLFGTIQGHVTDAATQLPMEGAEITLDGYQYHALTDAQGFYQIPDVLIGHYNVRAHYHRFNPDSSIALEVEFDSTEVQDFHMRHPVLSLSRTAILDSVWRVPRQTTFNLQNTGNGPADYSINILYAGDLSPNPWDSVGSINASTLTQDYDLRGVEYAFDRWWVTGSSATSGHRVLHKFDYLGNPAGDVELESTSANDWFDLAFDGTLIWGSVGHNIVGVDTLGVVHRTIHSPNAPTRALAYDSVTHHFWVADYISDLREIDTSGTVVSTIPNPGLTFTGLAWNDVDADGYKLYAFSMDGSPSQARVTKFHPTQRVYQIVTDLHGASDDRASGCTITPAWNSVLLVFAGIIRSDVGSRIQMHEMSFNTTWVSATPSVASVQGPASQEVTLRFDPSILRAAEYRVDLVIRSNVYDSTFVLPVTLVKGDSIDAATPRSEMLPTAYALRQNYPNPFNPTTQIRYDLKETGLTRLAVYNLLGEKVADLVNRIQPAGSYSISFDGASLSSGVYFYRLESGNFAQVHKMVLMK